MLYLHVVQSYIRSRQTYHIGLSQISHRCICDWYVPLWKPFFLRRKCRKRCLGKCIIITFQVRFAVSLHWFHFSQYLYWKKMCVYVYFLSVYRRMEYQLIHQSVNFLLNNWPQKSSIGWTPLYTQCAAYTKPVEDILLSSIQFMLD